MKELKDVLFTFDYELFLGEHSGTVGDCLIEPTKEIIDILRPHKIKGVFFIDTAYLLRLEEAGGRDDSAREDLGLVFSQLRSLVKEGHYVFMHLHPHWLDAKYDALKKEWQLRDLSRYRFHNLDDAQKRALFEEAMKLLKEIVSPVNPDLLLNGYRAGGWSIEPFEGFKPYFKEFNIKYDFSVLPGLSEFSAVRHFDYSGMPRNKSIYRFNDSVVREDENGDFIELCISVLRINKITGLLDRIWLKLSHIAGRDEYLPRGEGIVPVPLTPHGEEKSTNKGCEQASVEGMTKVKLAAYFDFLKKNSYMQLASHPKMVNRDNLAVFRVFLQDIFKRYQIETDFLKMV